MDATLTWSPNSEPDLAGYRVYYGTSSRTYGIPIDVKNVVRYTITDLEPDTYYFAVTAYNTSGMESEFSDEVSKTLGVNCFFPGAALSSGVNTGLSFDRYSAVALTNLDDNEAHLKFAAYGASGMPVKGVGITNPATKTMNPRAQLPVIDNQVFGEGISAAAPASWIKVESSVTDVAGLFMIFDSRLSFLEGGGIAKSFRHSFVFPNIESQGFTRVLLANPNDNVASARIDLVANNGLVRSSVSRIIPAKGALTADVYREIFPSVRPDASDYLRVISDVGLLAYQSFGGVTRDVAILSGLGIADGAGTLYSPQYVSGGRWRSTLSLVNLDAIGGTVTLRFMNNDGLEIGSKTLPLSPAGKVIFADFEVLENQKAMPPDQFIQGYLEITTDRIKLAGSVVFHDAEQKTFLCALPLISALQKEMIFSHIASNDSYFTGLAILNPTDTVATATIDLYDSDGRRIGRVVQEILPKQRRSGLLTEYFPFLSGQDRRSGYIRVAVDRNVAGIAVFGTNDLSVLSAIPSQPKP